MNNIIFKNESGEHIVENELFRYSNYSKHFIDEKGNTIIETYSNFKLSKVMITLNSLENKDSFIKFYDKVELIIHQKEKKGNFICQITMIYENQKPSYKCLGVKDKDNQQIMFQKRFPENDAIITTEKKYYENGELKYLFDYDEAGECFMVNDYSDGGQDFLASVIGKDDCINFSWEGFEYYKNEFQIFPYGPVGSKSS